MSFDLLIKVRKTLAFNKSHQPREQREYSSAWGAMVAGVYS